MRPERTKPARTWVAGPDGVLRLEDIIEAPASPIDHPPHYNAAENGLECFDAIVGALGTEGAVAYAKGAALKYIWRADHKGAPAEDLRKAAVYLNWAADLQENGPRKF